MHFLLRREVQGPCTHSPLGPKSQRIVLCVGSTRITFSSNHQYCPFETSLEPKSVSTLVAKSPTVSRPTEDTKVDSTEERVRSWGVRHSFYHYCRGINSPGSSSTSDSFTSPSPTKEGVSYINSNYFKTKWGQPTTWVGTRSINSSLCPMRIRVGPTPVLLCTICLTSVR